MSDAPLKRRRRKPDLLAWGLGLWVVLFMAFLLLPIIAVVVVSVPALLYILFHPIALL